MTSTVPPTEEILLAETGSGTAPRRLSALSYFATKVGGAAVSMVMVILLGFFAFKVLPGDPVATLARERQLSSDQIAQLRLQMGLDKPLWQQFVDYLVNVFTLNFGESYVYKTSVSSLIGQYFWNTILLTGTSAVLAIALGLWLRRRQSRLERTLAAAAAADTSLNAAVNQMWDAGERPTDVKTSDIRVIPYKDEDSDTRSDKPGGKR